MKRVTLLPVLALCACSSQQPEMAALVNGKPITMEDFRRNVAQAGPAADADSDSSGVLERMIEQELLAQKASRIRLDRLPEVSRALDNARTGILARAYVEWALSRDASDMPLSSEQALPTVELPTPDRTRAEAAQREARALRRKAFVKYFVELGSLPETVANAGADARRPWRGDAGLTTLTGAPSDARNTRSGLVADMQESRAAAPIAK
jgi:hypothetical protein